MNYSKILTILTITVLGLFMISCETDDVDKDSGDIRDEYVGDWNCNENSSLFGTSNYSISITKSESEGEVWIKNFHNLGDNVSARIMVEDNNIDLPLQVFESNEVEGSGTSAVNYKEMTLTYTAKSGGDNENVTAKYTKK
jgi:hypothetical protein